MIFGAATSAAAAAADAAAAAAAAYLADLDLRIDGLRSLQGKETAWRQNAPCSPDPLLQRLQLLVKDEDVESHVAFHALHSI